jgi:hypothetical protein
VYSARGGRLAFAVWGKAVENPWQSVLDDALAQYGIEDRTRKLEPGGMFGLSDETALRALLREAGFVVCTSEKLQLLGITETSTTIGRGRSIAVQVGRPLWAQWGPKMPSRSVACS